MNISHLKSICEAATPCYERWENRGRIAGDNLTLQQFGEAFTPRTVAKILAVVEAANVVVENYSWANLCSLGETLDAIKEERNENERRDS